MRYQRMMWSVAISIFGSLWLAAQATPPLHIKNSTLPPRGYARPPFHLKGPARSSPTGLSPAAIRNFYGFSQVANQGAGETIALVDAYDDPNIASDLNYFDSYYGLAPCNSSNGCFTKVYAAGKKPNSNSGWALEISLDVEWAHAIAPQAHILLVEAASNSFTNLLQAVQVAVSDGATSVSMSWGGGESSGETSYDANFNQAGVTFTASSGDSGSGVEYPAASGEVIGVGGTTITTNSNGSYLGETAWSGSGGGQSKYEPEPGYQSNLPIPYDSAGVRGVPDVAYDADPNTGVAVYDTVRYQGQAGWFQVGGTSAGSPQWAALFAIVNSERAAKGKSALSGTNYSVYDAAAGSSYAANFHDIINGSNGTCGTLCNAAAGYDYVTGLGSPNAPGIIAYLAGLP